MPRIPLPRELRGSAIRTSTSSDHGLTRARLRGPDIQHPFHGVSANGLDLTGIRARCLALVPAMTDGQAFSHTTALALTDRPSRGFRRICMSRSRSPARRHGAPGCWDIRSPDHPRSCSTGCPVSPAAEAWAQSAALLDRDDLVAVGDHLLLGKESATTLADLAAQWQGRPGGARLRWAAARVRPGVRSRPETHLRLLLVRSRLPEPVVAYPVVVSGGLVLQPDLAYPLQRLALEYEGFDHFTTARRIEADIERRELLAEASWRTIRVTAPRLYGDPARLVARVRRHLTA